MLFNGLPFLIFAPLFMVAYFSTRGSLRLWICLLSSYLFYGWWDWRFLSLILVSTAVDFFVGRRLQGETRPSVRKGLLVTSMVSNLTLLGVFKYFNFFVDSLVTGLHALGVDAHGPALRVVVPVGISFYTFQTMSYTIDVYRGRVPTERSVLRFATFVAFFPQLVAGPIVRAHTMLPQLRRDHAFDLERFIWGLGAVIWGYFLKVGVADSLALVVDPRFAEPQAYSSASLLVGVLFYCFQIYCDFAGYSLIAIGLGHILGFKFPTNFNRPYFSASFSEFWTRWHISLSSWLRDYLYIPLGGNRKGSIKTYRNLALTMLLGGLWHGAAWRFVVWGGLHGLYLVLQRLLGPGYSRLVRILRVPAVGSRVLLILVVFLLTNVAWVFFRAQSLSDAFYILGRLVNLRSLDVASIGSRFLVAKGAALIAIVVGVETLSLRFPIADILARRPMVAAAAAAVAIWIMLLFGTFSHNAFIYFQF